MTALKRLGVAAIVALVAPSFCLAQAQPTVVAAGGQPGTDASTPAITPMAAAPASPEQQSALASGDNTTVTNGPVPDTPANRAKYGGPMSRTGKKTAPKGN
jgi:hypothetical protein